MKALILFFCISLFTGISYACGEVKKTENEAEVIVSKAVAKAMESPIILKAVAQAIETSAVSQASNKVKKNKKK